MARPTRSGPRIPVRPFPGTKPKKRGYGRLAAGLTIVLVIAIGLAFLWARRASRLQAGRALEPVPAPSELEQGRKAFLEAIDEMRAGHGEAAANLLASLNFDGRPVEQYRLFYLAESQRLAGRPTEARRTLARLSRRSPTLRPRGEAMGALAGIYEGMGDFSSAAKAASLAADPSSAEGREAALRAAEDRFMAGDLGGLASDAATLVQQAAGTPEAAVAEAVLRDLTVPQPGQIPWAARDRIAQARSAVEGGRHAHSLDLTAALTSDSGATEDEIEEAMLIRAIALQKTGRHEASNTAVELLLDGKRADRALVIGAANDRALANAVRVVSERTVVRSVKSGTKKVRTKSGKLVIQPVYRKVKQTIRRTDKAGVEKRRQIELREAARLDLLLELANDLPVVRDALTRRIELAVKAEDPARVKELVPGLVAIDSWNDSAANFFWSRGWTAWTKKDLNLAAEEFAFLHATYRHPTVQRQGRYWYARSIDRLGEKARAAEIYREIADGPYRDVYGRFARERLGLPAGRPGDQRPSRPPWPLVAERSIPPELRLAWELTVLGAGKEAREEVRANTRDRNRAWADAILAELHYAQGQLETTHRLLRRAFPTLGTVGQDAVPDHFIRMYYPHRFEDEIRKAASHNGVDSELVMGLIHQESSFEIRARSRVGAIGLMQIMPATGREQARKSTGAFQISDLDDPGVNIGLGTRYLAELLRAFDGRPELAVAAYNAGPGRVRGWRRRSARQPIDEFVESIPIPETKGYVKRVMFLWSAYENL